MIINNKQITCLIRNVLGDLTFRELKSKYIILNKDIYKDTERTFITESYLDKDHKKINCLKLCSTKPIRTVENGFVVVRKKCLYLTSNRTILVANMTNTITPIDNNLNLDEKITSYKKCLIEYVIDDSESYEYYSKFDFSKYDLDTNPIDLILENIDKRIISLQKRVDKLISLKESVLK